jgi:CelD/BcsL family acetyltransferase involved in cellulose biosynthesis
MAGPLARPLSPTRQHDLGARLNGLVLVVAAVVSGALNYGYTLVMLHALQPIPFSHFFLMSSLLLLAGSWAAVSVPWVLAREVAQTRPGESRRRRAVHFSLATALAEGIVAAGVVCTLSARYASWGLRGVAVLACIAVFVNAVGVGYVQGCQRFRLVAGLLVLESVVKFASGMLSVSAGASDAKALFGLAIGASSSALAGLWFMRAQLHGFHRAVLSRIALSRELWAEAGGLTAVQGTMALLQGVDAVVLGLTMANTAAAAGYQAMLVLARTPLYLAPALAAVVFTRLVADGTTRPERLATVTENLRTYLLIAGLVGAGIASVPLGLLRAVVPAAYAPYRKLLIPLALAAVACGVITLLVSSLQAGRRYRFTALLLSGLGPALAAILAWQTPDPVRVAWCAAAGLLLAAVLLARVVASTWRGVNWPWTCLVVPPATFTVLKLTGDRLTIWVMVLVAACAAIGSLFLFGRGQDRLRTHSCAVTNRDSQQEGLKPMRHTRTAQVLRRRQAHHRLDVVTDLWQLESAWQQLSALNPTPIQSFAWAAATEQVYGGRQPFIGLTVAGSDGPVAIAPLRRPPGRLTELTLSGHDEPIDLLYQDEPALATLCDGLVRLGMPLKLFQLLSSSPTVTQLTRAFARRGLVLERGGNCPVVTLDESWQEPERRFNSGRRSDLRRARRRAEAEGPVTFEMLAPAPDHLETLMDEAIRVEAANWKGKAGTAIACRPRYTAFFRTWARYSAADGTLRLAFLRVAGTAVAVQICAEQDHRLWLLKIGYDDAFARCSPGNLLMLEVVRWAAARDLHAVEFLGGSEPWTTLWATGTRPYTTLAAYPPRPMSLPRAAQDAITVARKLRVSRKLRVATDDGRPRRRHSQDVQKPGKAACAS